MRKRILTYLLLAIIPLATFAQNEKGNGETDGYMQLLKNAKEANKRLSDQKRAISKTIQAFKKKENQLNDSINTLQKDSTRLKSDIGKLIEGKTYKKYSKLREKRDSLLAVIKSQDTILASISQRMEAVTSQLDSTNKRKAEIDKYKTNFSKDLIADYEAKLEKPFSEIDLTELESIREECLQYTSDNRIKAFVEKIGQTLVCKEQYDGIVKVLDSPYNASGISKALQETTQIKCNSVAQKSELETAKKQLDRFVPGIEAMKELVNAINAYRAGMENFKYQDFLDVRDMILEQNNLGNRINENVMVVPYLKKAYEAFMKALKAAPTKHSAIEEEILKTPTGN